MPSYVETQIIDEDVEPINFDTDADLIGISLMTYNAPRAYEIADILMAQNRIARRLATQVVRRPWKQRIVDDLDCAFGTEMFGMFCANELHSDLTSMIDYLGMTGKIVPPLQGKIK